MIGNPLLGSWKLVSFHVKSADGRITYPWGREVAGYITYTDQGRVLVAIMRDNRPKQSSEDIWGGTAEEKAAAYETYISYAGAYEIQGDKVVHHVEVSLFPNWVGTELVRFLELEGERLFLNTAPVLVSGIMQTGHLVWERVSTT